MLNSYERTSLAKKGLLLCVCSSLWQSLQAISASVQSCPEAVAGQAEAGSLGTCSQGSSLLQVSSKPSRTVSSTFPEDDSTAAHEVSQPILLATATSKSNTSVPSWHAALLEAGHELLLAQQTQMALVKLSFSLVLVLCFLGSCLVCIISRLKSDPHRRDRFMQDGGRLSATFGQMPPGASRSLGLSRHAVSQHNVGFRGERTPKLATGSAAAISSRTLCPGLVVPDSSDCVLVIRTLRRRQSTDTDLGDAAAGRGPIENQIFDLVGKAVLSASIAQPWPRQGKPVVTLHTLHSPRTAEGGWLSLCRAGQDSKGASVYDKDDAIFASLARDGARYVLLGNAGEFLLFFEGSFQDHRVHILDARGNMIAHTEPCKMDFEPEGSFYQARVAAGVDVGIVLSCLLSIDAMEAR